MNDPTYYVDEIGERGVPIYDVWPEGAQVWVYKPEGAQPVAGMYPQPCGHRFWVHLWPEEAMPPICGEVSPGLRVSDDFAKNLEGWVATHFKIPLGWQLHRAWVIVQFDWRGICCVIVPQEGAL